jgi:hypothetical protein
MQITSTRRPIFRQTASNPAKSSRLALGITKTQSKKSKFWRDYGVNPIAMFDRAFVNRPPKDGTPLNNGLSANRLVTTNLRTEFHRLLNAHPQQEQLQNGIVDIAERFGVKVNLEKGVPLVNWDEDEPGTLDVRHSGGTSANHELVHAIQCTIGGAAAMGTLASQDFESETGRPPQNVEELQSYIQSLTGDERAQAMQMIVTPMEEQAYHTFEEAAFHATGMMGKRSKNQEYYLQRLGQVVDSYTEAYQDAAVPRLETSIGPRIYGHVGHIARTNGETALMLGGVAVGYSALARQAMKLHPLMAIPVATPLVYGLYRALVSG